MSRSVESAPSEGSFDDNREGMNLERASENKREIEADVQRKDVGVQVNMDDESLGFDQTKDSRIGENDPSLWSTASWKGVKWGKTPKKKGRGLKGTKKRKFGNSSVGPSSDIGKPQCLRRARMSRSVESDPSEGSYEEHREEMKLERASGDQREIEVERKDVGVQVNMDEEDDQNRKTEMSGVGESEPSTWSTATWKGVKWGNTSKKKVRGLKGSKKNKRLGYDVGVSSGRGRAKCERCGRMHKGVCLAGTTACFRCGQEGHMMRECPIALRIVQSQQTLADRMAPANRQEREATTSATSVPEWYLQRESGELSERLGS
ncbi:uncharacterized protein LOC110621571 [Manihot esculenta]|uniref:uncharacterized protein LOC110621571 n=1 Tax=Manihot esculenta TaxID=3983 RepID=UPI000B5D151C|nr:uncharacterized protein LOC110621571 [Manihot esculenta]